MTLELEIRNLGCGPFQVCTNVYSMSTSIHVLARLNFIPNAFILDKS